MSLDLPQDGGITMEELEEAKGLGVGILDSDTAQGNQAYRQELIQICVNAVTIEIAGLTKRDFDKIPASSLGEVFGRLMSSPTNVIEARVMKLTQEKPELMALAMTKAKVRVQRSRKSGDLEIISVDRSLETPNGRYITEEEFETGEF